MTRTVRRGGFTLVELLVVIALIILLAALTAAVVQTGMLTSQKVVSAADRASGWLLIAKQRALRDGAPRGVRFLMTPDPLAPGSFRVTEGQYIESPEPWIPNTDSNPTGPRIVLVYIVNPANPMVVAERHVFFVSDQTADINDLTSRVFAGDMLVLPEFGSSFRLIGNPAMPPATPVIAGITAANARELPLAQNTFPDLAAGHSLLAASPNPTPPTMSTNKFAFQPQPRPLLGEPTVQLTGNTVIDFRDALTPTALPLTTTGVFPQPPLNQPTTEQRFFDILFTPSGAVVASVADPGLIFLWVRDPDLTPHPRQPDDATGYNMAGEQVLVTINTQTGLISTHPVKPPPYADPVNEPYQFARDGASSGL